MRRILFVRPGVLACLCPEMELPTHAQESGPATQSDSSNVEVESTSSTAQAMRSMDRFRGVDTDRSGAIDREESLLIPTLRRWPDLFDRIDTDGNGRISAAEFLALATYSDALRAARRSADEGVLGGVRRRADIVYLPEGDPILQSLDLYVPMPLPATSWSSAKGEASALESRSFLIMIHGGGWKHGDKANAGVSAPKAGWAVDRGWVFARVNYRLSPVVQHPDHAVDVAAAIA